jgi:predicted nucleic acid-binding protein
MNYLVASMLANNLQKILTFNTDDFKRYKEITVVHPNEV